MNPRSLHDWLARLERRHPQAIDLGLDRVREVAQRMGLDKPARCVVTVGGTITTQSAQLTHVSDLKTSTNGLAGFCCAAI